ncbi:M60 family metallopeptidase [Pedobacter sp. MW01-1-1]|uniref:M60 family metallopeptidase n=1 Tax=Pedobacter sp. MW01-1-1 TaxID=3383027 RepID=UPI003FEF710E
MKRNYQTIILSLFVITTLFACKKYSSVLVEPKSISEIVAPATQTYTEGVGSQAVANRLGQANHNEMLVTGYYVAPNDSMYVTVTQISGNRLPQLALGTPFRDNVRPVRKYYTLQPGLNKLKADGYGGIMWVKYNSSATPAASASISFGMGFNPLPCFRKDITTQAEWATMLDTLDNVPDAMIITDHAVVIARREDAITYQAEDQQSICTKIDDIINAEDAFSGIDNSSDLHAQSPYKYLITVKEPANSGDYMAAGIGIFYVRPLTYRILQNEHLGGIYGWGLWHEIGHIHQQGVWKWSGLGEVTVNLYSLAAERHFGVTPSRLNRDGIWTSVDNYLALPQANRNFNGTITNANGVRLGMFYQLWMQYGDSFYIALSKQTRVEKPTVPTDADKMRYFMLKACTVSGNNLTDFFQKWGLPVAQSVYDEIAALGLPAPTNDLTTLRD